jgi:hypothetical protein
MVVGELILDILDGDDDKMIAGELINDLGTMMIKMIMPRGGTVVGGTHSAQTAKIRTASAMNSLSFSRFLTSRELLANGPGSTAAVLVEHSHQVGTRPPPRRPGPSSLIRTTTRSTPCGLTAQGCGS